MELSKLQPRKSIKVSEIPPEGFFGTLIDILPSLHGRQYIFKDETGIEISIFSCSAIDRCLSQNHIGRHLKILYKGRIILPDGKTAFDVDTFEIQK